ncbi:hypothetical protein [Roseomonas indoligenes]|uniref:Uncharacterized protein n=1 Tax=Roseomonas indoligenes TaxID=2820811 RepID=A0A940S540_9PROT|nr:hypothetical protein [Pararoseomonas indoligenes]MBP0493991.1 hypothetical protein [Pararoseomonas indoligenes]
MQKTTRIKRRRVKAAPTIYAPIRLMHLPAALHDDGEPRVMLEVPPGPGSITRRPMLRAFATIAAALAAKAEMEGRH